MRTLSTTGRSVTLGFRVTAGTPSPYLAPGGGGTVGDSTAATDTMVGSRVRGVTLLRGKV